MMISKVTRSVLPLFLAFLLAACVLPVPIPQLNASEVTENEIEELVSRHSSRTDVIEILGRPLRYRKNEISYLACRTESGVVYLFLGGFHGGVVGGSGGNLKCKEYVLSFDGNDLLASVSVISQERQIDERAEDLNLRDLGNQGDLNAQNLWEKSRTYYMSQQQDIVDERKENERRSITKKRELATDLTERAESGDAKAQLELYMLEDKSHLEWLCRSADQGYMKAEMWLGYLYETGSYGCPRDYARSYLWYRRAAIGEYQKEVERWIKRIENKRPKQYSCESIPCDIAINITSVKGRLKTDPGGLSRANSMLEQWKPGQCEQELTGSDWSIAK